MTIHALISNKAVWISALCSVIVVSYDFFTRVTVPLNPDNGRVIDWSYSAPTNNQPRDIPESLTQWLKASEESAEDVSDNREQKVPDMPGSSRVGDVNVRVRAIFTGDDSFAIAEIQATSQQPERQLLRLGDTINQFKVTELTSQYVLLRLVEEYKASRDAADEPKYLYVFEPRNPTN